MVIPLLACAGVSLTSHGHILLRSGRFLISTGRRRNITAGFNSARHCYALGLSGVVRHAMRQLPLRQRLETATHAIASAPQLKADAPSE